MDVESTFKFKDLDENGTPSWGFSMTIELAEVELGTRSPAALRNLSDMFQDHTAKAMKFTSLMCIFSSSIIHMQTM